MQWPAVYCGAKRSHNHEIPQQTPMHIYRWRPNCYACQILCKRVSFLLEAGGDGPAMGLRRFGSMHTVEYSL